jgi:virginiamycin B lyase
MTRSRIAAWLGFALGLASLGLPTLAARAAVLPGLGEIEGAVTAPRGAIVPVYLYNAQRKVGYAVFAVDGRYRATQLFPGRYEITVRHNGLEMAPVIAPVAADGKTQADLAPRVVAAAPNYTGGHTYRSVVVEPYERIYPAGPGRQIVERTCTVCHGVNFLPGKQFDRRTWESFVHYMTREPAFRNGGIVKGPSLMDPARLSDADLPVLLDYLAANFGTGAKVRAVQQEQEPRLDPVALSKAMYIEYRFPNTPSMPNRWTQEPHFDRDGNVYVTDRGNPAVIVRVDPRTGESKDFLTPVRTSSPHGLAVDGDGTIWWSGRNNFLAHLDPKTGLTDQYPATQQGLHGHTPVFDSKGDLWFSMLVGRKLGHWDRKSDTVSYYETPSPRGHPYGLVVDHQDNVWYVEYFTDHVVRFDPRTKAFKRFPIKSAPASLRRLGVDSRDIIWYGVYGTVGKAGKLGRLDPKTGAVTERTLPIQYSNPYDTWPDDQDNIWISSDNYLTKFDPRTEKYTVYPTPERTDQPKIMLTRDGATWFTPRLAGRDGYGGAASVLYPDKDAIPTLGAYYSPKSSANHVAKYRGPFTKVTGVTKVSRDGALNPEMPGERTVGRPMTPAGAAGASRGSDDRVGD